MWRCVHASRFCTLVWVRVGAVYADPQYRNKAVHRFQFTVYNSTSWYVVLLESYIYWELGDFNFFAIGSASASEKSL